MGSRWGQDGFKLGSRWGQGGVKLESPRGQAGVNLWSIWGQSGVKLGSSWGQPGVNPGPTWGQPAPPCLGETRSEAEAPPLQQRQPHLQQVLLHHLREVDHALHAVVAQIETESKV